MGCTKKLCLEKNIKELNLDLKPNYIENLNTINSNKNEQTKQANNEEENNINNNNDKDQSENIENDNEQSEEEEEEEEEEEKEEKKEVSNEAINQYKKDISKIILIQKTFKKHYPTMRSKNNQTIKKSSTKKVQETKIEKDLFSRFNTINYLSSKISNNDIKKTVHKYDYSIILTPEKDNGKKISRRNEDEEIISVEQAYMPIQIKNSSKVVSNFYAMDALKSSLVQNSKIRDKTKQTLLKAPSQNANYLRILSDFGERKNTYFKETGKRESNNLLRLLTSRERRDKKENRKNKNQDVIKGNFILKNEKVIRYQGGFIKKTKKKNGFGIVTWSDSSTLHGTYKSSTINGIARFYNNKYKSTFIGEYANNIPKGFGVYKVKSLSLQGYWDCSSLNGIVIEVWEDGTYFQGEYENNKKNGIGLYRWPDGTIYQGEFNNGEMTGKGIILYIDDSVFSGEMLNGYMNGYGIFSWGNGSLYMGYYLQDIKHGFGIYVWDSKMFICYIGFWEMGKQQGIGAKINGNKIKYCIWNKGKIATTLKGLYEIDRYLTRIQKGYYHFFTPAYIAKLRASSIYNFNPK